MSVALSKMNKKELYVECKRLHNDNMKLQLLQDENLIKENEDFKREKLMLHNVCNEYKKENNKLTEEVLERDTHIDIIIRRVVELKDQITYLDSEQGTRELIDKYFSNEPESSCSNTLLKVIFIILWE